jgi:hypothetical protein
MPRERELEIINFGLKDEESNSTEEHESGEEPHTPILRISVWERRKLERYTPPNFHSSFSLYITHVDPRTIR